ncbi:hypothetical protein, partial [Gulosibacter bifidus]
MTFLPVALLNVVGCASLTETASDSSDAVPTIAPADARDRSIELQREIVEMIPAVDREDNFLPGVDAKPTLLYFCKPILSEDYYESSGEDVEAVQYPGLVYVALDRGAS